jgi:dynein heavy chain
MFAGIINNTTMDYHHAWPTDALVGVADRFLEEIDFDTPELRHTVSEHMAFCHNSIDEANTKFLLAERRNNYVTPTSFLELIKFYKTLLNDKRGKIIEQIKRLEIGLQTMEDTNKVVADLSVELDETMVIVDAEKEATGKLIAVVDAEAADAAREEAIAKEQEDATNIEAGNA